MDSGSVAVLGSNQTLVKRIVQELATHAAATLTQQKVIFFRARLGFKLMGGKELLATTNKESAVLPQESIQPTPDSTESGTKRFLSLDVFRGMNIWLMLIVNNAAMNEFTPPMLVHAEWKNEVHFADLVFPWFLFCVGLSIPFSAISARAKGISTLDEHKKVWRRGLIIFAWGLFYSSCVEARPVFTLGVLQLIAMAYVAGWYVCQLPARKRLWLCALTLLGYGVVLQFCPFPGGPGFTEKHNLLKWFYDFGFFKVTRIAGIFAFIPTFPLVVAGCTVSEKILLAGSDWGKKLGQMVFAGALLVCMGQVWSWTLQFHKPFWTPSYILSTCGTAMWGLAFTCWIVEVLQREKVYNTMNQLFKWGGIALASGFLLRFALSESKLPWMTPGLVATNLLFVAGSLVIWWKWIEPEKLKKWPLAFTVFGSNALLAYVLPVAAKLIYFKSWTLPYVDGKRYPMHEAAVYWSKSLFGSLLGGAFYTMAYVLMWWLVIAFFNRRGWYLKA